MSFFMSPVGMFIVFGIVLFGIISVYNQLDPASRYSKNIKKRLNKVSPGDGKNKTGKKQPSVIDITGGQNKTLFDTIVSRIMPRPEKLRNRLSRTGKEIGMGQYIGAMIIITFVATMILKAVVGFTIVNAFFIGLILGLGIPHKYTGRLINKRNKAFINQFPEAIDLVVRGVRSGLPIGESIKSIAKEMAEPIKTEFTIVNDSMKLGETVEKALWTCSERLDIAEVKFFVIALSIQRETGGNLAETLENLSTIIRKRRYMQMKIKAMSSEARASAMIIGSLPFAMFGILMVMNPKYIRTLLIDPRGHMLIAVGLALIFTGNFIMRKLAAFKI